MIEHLNILVVEDDAALRDAVCFTLEMAGHGVTGVDGGPAALEELDRQAFNLVVTDLKPNRPTMQQAIDRPGLSIQDSVSIGGATIEGEVVTADGQRLPVRYSRYSNSIADVFGYTTWSDAGTAFDRLAGNLSRGRLVSR